MPSQSLENAVKAIKPYLFRTYPSKIDFVFFDAEGSENIFGNLTAFIHSKLHSAIVMYLDVENQVNAFASRDETKEIIVLLVGTFQHLIRDAKLVTQHEDFFMLFPNQDIFPFLTARPEEVKMLGQQLMPVFKFIDDIELDTSDNSMDYDRFVLTDLIVEIALRFIALHEIGHHMNGDLKKDGLAFNAASDVSYSRANLSREKYKHRRRMEQRADRYATSELVKDFREYYRKVEYCFSQTNELEIFLLLSSSIMFALLAMPSDGITIENADFAVYMKKEYRLLDCFSSLLSAIYTNEDLFLALCSQIAEEYKTKKSLRKLFNQLYPKQEPLANGLPTENAIDFYAFTVFSTTVCIYCETKGVKAREVMENITVFAEVYASVKMAWRDFD